MSSPRDILNELKWTTGLADVEIHYIHRGAPGDEKTVRAEDIMELGRGFFTIPQKLGESSIPYHRVLLVERRGEVLWRRRQTP